MTRGGLHVAGPDTREAVDAAEGQRGRPASPSSGRSQWPTLLRPADEFFVLAHHPRTGEPLLHPRPLGLGVAGALLSELILAGRISVTGPAVTVTEAVWVQERVADELLSLAATQDPAPLQDWLAFLTSRCAQAITDRLVREGLLVREEQQRLRRRAAVVRYRPSNSERAYWRTVRLARLAVLPGPEELGDALSDADVVLAGLVTATSLLDTVIDTGLPGADTGAARHRIDDAVAALPADLAAVVAGVQRAVGDAVLSART